MKSMVQSDIGDSDIVTDAFDFMRRYLPFQQILVKMLPDFNMNLFSNYQLDEDFAVNEVNYFFCILGPRFDEAVQRMAQSLSRRFGKDFCPIVIYSGVPAEHLARGNYIVLNEQSREVELVIGKPAIYLQEYEDLNVEFLQSVQVQEIIKCLSHKQDKIFVYSFTTAFLKVEAPLVLLGPNAEIAQLFDSKIKQWRLFDELDIPRNKARIFSTSEELMMQGSAILPCYITAQYTSGGAESALIYSKGMLESFVTRLREINRSGPFLVSEIFQNLICAPNVNAVVTGIDEVSVLIISDQILSGNRYLGNTYPTVISAAHQELIKEITIKIGNYLSRKDYRGVFGCDFLINAAGRLVTVDLNPRRQGGYACNVLMLEQAGISLTDIELACALGASEGLKIDYNQAQVPFAWAHMKLKPHEPGLTIIDEYRINTMSHVFEHPGASFTDTFYKKYSLFIDGYVGYLVTTGKEVSDLEAILKTLEKEATIATYR